MFKFFRKIYSILVALFIALISLGIAAVAVTEIFKIELNFWIALMVFSVPILAFIGSYSALKSDSKCEKCQETFSKRKIKTDILSKEKIQEDIKENGKYVRQAFWVGEKENFYQCENCGHITSKITKYKEKI